MVYLLCAKSHFKCIILFIVITGSSIVFSFIDQETKAKKVVKLNN